MADAATPPGDSPEPLSNSDELRAVWDEFRAGRMVACPSDASPMALSVDASVGVYRFVCTRCGTSSSWFQSGPAGLTIRATAGKAFPTSD